MLETKNSRWKIITNQLRNKYRLVILNDSSFAEKFSLKLSPLTLIILIGSLTIVLISIVISTIAFTPLREYIPGYGNVDDRKNIILLSYKADSLESTLAAKEWYMNNLLNVFSGKVQGKPVKPVKDSTGKYKNIPVSANENDVNLRHEIENNILKSTSTAVSAKTHAQFNNFFFFSPVQGIVTSSYNINEAHFGVDIVTKENELVKASLDGTVVFTGFTADDGYIIHVQHSNDLVSIYKHNSAITKTIGQYVKAGEPIAIVGNTGENSKGAHLHFELWHNGFAINPQDYVVF